MVKLALPTVFLLLLSLSTVLADARRGDEAAVRAATLAYSQAWIANDAAAVMKTLVPEPVLLPSGLAPLLGVQAVRRFWWPGTGPATRVIDMRQEIDAVVVSGDVAYTRGRGTLTYAIDPPAAGAATPTILRSTFLNILRRQADGRWLIAERMWSDLRAQ